MTPATGILFVGAEDEENLSIRSLAAFCQQAGIAAHIAGFSCPRETPQVLAALDRHKPAMLAVSLPFQCKGQENFAMLAQVRATGFTGHIVVGGHFPTFEYQRILESQPAIDTVIRFEGEHGLVPLYHAVRDGADLAPVPNLVYRDGATLRENPCIHAFMDLDALPFPLRSSKPQWYVGERFSTLISSRGCWHSSCTYCCIGAFHGPKGAKFALRSAANVADEIALLHRTHGTTFFQFHDDNFILATPADTCLRLHDLARELDRRGLKRHELIFLIKARPDVIEDSVADALRELGCVCMFLGVENASASGQHAYARGADMPAVLRAMDVLHQRKIAVSYNLLLFHPRASIDEIHDNTAFIRRHPDVPFDIARAEIVAHSPLERLILHENLRDGTWPHWDYRLPDPAVQRAFDLYRVAFRAPSAHCLLKDQLIKLNYHAAVALRRCAGPSANALHRATAAMIASANIFIADRIDEMLALAQAAPDLFAHENLPPAVTAFQHSLDEGCHRYLPQAVALSRELTRLQTTERVFKRFGLQSMVQETPWLRGLFGIRQGVLAS